MYLRLYKKPYLEPFKNDSLRLLFEGVIRPVHSTDLAGDFYLYTWILEGTELASFQAVLNDSITLVYRKPDYLTVGRIGRAPMNRAIAGASESDDKSEICAVMKNLENDYFPHLLSLVEKIACGESVSDLNLCDKEVATLADLRRKADQEKKR